MLFSCSKTANITLGTSASAAQNLTNAQILNLVKNIGIEHNKILTQLLQNAKKNGIVSLKSSSRVAVNSKDPATQYKVNLLDPNTVDYIVDNTIDQAFLSHPEFSDPQFQLTPEFFNNYAYTYNIATSDIGDVVQAFENNDPQQSSPTFDGMVADIHNMIYSIDDIQMLKTQLAQYRDNNINNLSSDAEKIALAGGINVAIASIDFWDQNYDDWMAIFGNGGPGLSVSSIRVGTNSEPIVKRTDKISPGTLKGIVMGDAYGALKGMIQGAIRGSYFDVQSAAVAALANGLIQGVIYSAEGGLIGALVDWLW